ncbi:MAG: DUF6510 family protein [Chloroflexota bacterium]
MDSRESDPMTDQVLDGNAVAGMLESLLGADMTVIPGRCASCGAVSMIGAMPAYVRAPGAVLRCPACTAVIVRIVETDTLTYVDVRGAAYLRFERR